MAKYDDYVDGYVKLAYNIVLDAIRLAVKGEEQEILWLISDDAKFYFDSFDLSTFDRDRVLMEVASALIRKGKKNGQRNTK
jgi:hypothetical protein